MWWKKRKVQRGGHVCNPPSLTRSSPWVDIVRWNCPICGRRFEKRYPVG